MHVKMLISLQGAGVDVDRVVKRFAGNSAMYEKFLMKFPEDENFEKAVEAFQNKNWNELETSVHTLKGVSGNLGFDRLYNVCSKIVLLLRENRQDELEKPFAEMKVAYEEIVRVLTDEVQV